MFILNGNDRSNCGFAVDCIRVFRIHPPQIRNLTYRHTWYVKISEQFEASQQQCDSFDGEGLTPQSFSQPLS